MRDHYTHTEADAAAFEPEHADRDAERPTRDEVAPAASPAAEGPWAEAAAMTDPWQTATTD